MTYVLFIDDEKSPKDLAWDDMPQGEITQIVRSYDTMTKTVQFHGLPMFICFDYDLNDKKHSVPKTGFDCAKWLVNAFHKAGKPFPQYIIQSEDEIGRARISGYIEHAKTELGL